jgi:RNA-directed DNA polymerase
MEPLLGNTGDALKSGNVYTKQQRIAELAKLMVDASFTSLAYLIDLEWLREAYRCTRKDGAAGVDEVTAEEYEKDLEGNLQSLLDRFKSGRYHAPPVKRVYIPKGDGAVRPIGIPALEDKILQRAVVMVLTPLYEQDFLDCSYGFRPGRSAHQALEALWHGIMRRGGCWVLEVDIRSYFDSIPQDKLMGMVERRIADRSVLMLIRMWLRSPVVEEDGGGSGRQSRSGTPQGGVISPLLANIYLHELDRAFHEDEDGPYRRANARLVRYADDLVVLARYLGARITGWMERKLEGDPGLHLNRNKTRIARMGERGESLSFLGFTLRYDRDLMGRNTRYLNEFPSKKAVFRLRDKVRGRTLVDRRSLSGRPSRK